MRLIDFYDNLIKINFIRTNKFFIFFKKFDLMVDILDSKDINRNQAKQENSTCNRYSSTVKINRLFLYVKPNLIVYK
jgi:hypothetical protein